MKVCLISNQIAAWGKIGGFGTATRAIGRGLASRGIEVCAVVPRRGAQRKVGTLDGITVYGLSAREAIMSNKIYRAINADIYHSQEPTIASYHAQKAQPNRIHIVTSRDPRTFKDQLVELRYTNWYRRLIYPVIRLYEHSVFVKKAVQHADAVWCPAPFLIPKIRKLYNLNQDPQFIPSPVDVPESESVKSQTPTALFVGRWDRRKRIELFFELAEKFPSVNFIAVGKSHDSKYDRHLRSKYRHLKNVDMPGFVDRFSDDGLLDLYNRSWILVNTSAREGLPYTFVEAAARGCSILSSLNPDEFATEFGYYVDDDDFAKGLSWLLENNRWREKGKKGAQYVRKIFSEENSIKLHLKNYKDLLDKNEKEIAF